MTPITLYTNTPEFYNDICEEIRLFFSADQIILKENPITPAPPDQRYFSHTVSEQNGKGRSETVIYNDSAASSPGIAFFELDKADPIAAKRQKKAAVKLSTYLALKALTGKQPLWGALTGIRPTKLLREQENRTGISEAKRYLIKTLEVSEDRYRLAKQIIDRQRPIIDTAGDNAMDIYINIPFCPSRCAYCSFLSAVTSEGDPVQQVYMDMLIKEIKAMSPVIAAHHIRSVYIGGGTPTSLDDAQFERLLHIIKAHIPHVPEFTVEAGRPDTITPEKLACMRRHQVTRISINPQTFRDSTLTRVGRNHSIEDFNRAYRLAKANGFDHINIDLIFGLPGERLRDMKRSLKKAIRQKPESITIHTLAIKNASKLTRDIAYSEKEAVVLKAVDDGRKTCEKQGLYPYYMYRQKYMKGNLENVGYCKPGNESVYNIDMMEEVCSVLALGAGAISKRVYPSGGRLERCANVKDIKGYIDRINEMIATKKAHFGF